MSSAVSSSTASTASTAASTAASAASSVISSTGIGSGLDINSIVSTLTTSAGSAENYQLSSRKSTIDAQVSAYSTFSSALSTLQATLTTLTTPSSLAARTATLGDTTIASASADSNATPASYTLAVQNLATASSLSSAPISTANSSVGTGTLNISVGGNSAAISIDSSDNTLSGIASAINNASNNPGVTATVLSTTAGSRLVISGTATGAANAVTVTSSGGDGGLASLNFTQTQAAQDANFTINGFAATSSSNQVSSAISGVTLTLLKPTATDTPTTLTVGNDTSTASTSIGTFVTALNGLINSVQSLTSYDPSTKTAGPLLGNATLQSFQNQLQKILGQVTSGNGSSGLTSLASLGITADPSGGYSTNSTKLTNALSGNLSAVGNLLGGTNGIATQLNSLINTYTQTGGLLDSINKGLQSGLSDISTQQTALNARLSTYSATLTKEYNAMDTAVALLKQTQSYLNAEFNSSSSSSSTSSSSSLSSGTLST